MSKQRVGNLAKVFALAAFVFFISVSPFAQQRSDGAKQGLALVGGKIYPEPFSKPIADGIVVIEKGK